MYSFVTAYCGFEPNGGESKVMGLAPYGGTRFDDALAALADVGPDGSVRVHARRLRWFAASAPRDRRIHRALGGPPRRPDAPLTEREADLAASVERLTERAMLAMARRAHELTGADALCLAGGVALNGVANGVVLRDGPFDHLWVQPAAGDAGSAVGAALSHWCSDLGGRRAATGRDAMSGGFLGPDASAADALAAVTAAGVPYEQVEDEAALADLVAERLAAGDVVGWCTGRMEFGPRALGHRSILADPRSDTVRGRINDAVKGRESFRPFAPAVQPGGGTHRGVSRGRAPDRKRGRARPPRAGRGRRSRAALSRGSSDVVEAGTSTS